MIDDTELKRLIAVSMTYYNLIQRRPEILRLLKMVQDIKPKTICELGVAMGGTYFLWSKMCPDAKLVGVDLPGAEFSMFDGIRVTSERVQADIQNPNGTILLVDSHNPSTVEKVKELLGEIDFLFIDGDHTYDGVKKDFEMYTPLLSKNGLVAMHDIIRNNVSECRVDIFWKEIKNSYDSEEIVNDYDQGDCGIGVIHWGPTNK